MEGHQDSQGWSHCSVCRGWETSACLTWTKESWGEAKLSFLVWRGHQGNRSRLLTMICSRRMTENRHKLKEVSFRLDVKNTFFIMRTAEQQSMMLRKDVQSLSLEVFKTWLDQSSSELLCVTSELTFFSTGGWARCLLRYLPTWHPIVLWF